MPSRIQRHASNLENVDSSNYTTTGINTKSTGRPGGRAFVRADSFAYDNTASSGLLPTLKKASALAQLLLAGPVVIYGNTNRNA